MPDKIHLQGVLLFLFIPIVLFLFLQHPFGVPLSVAAGILIMFGHRFVARPFFLRYAHRRCFWCAKTSNPRVPVEVQAGGSLSIDLCNPVCKESAKRFFDFCNRYRLPIRIGIFLPLVFYIVVLLFNDFGLIHLPAEWNKFIFRFFIALTVVTISFAYRAGNATRQSLFPFPIHNLFLIGAKNTLLVFRYVGIWWLMASIYFLISS